MYRGDKCITIDDVERSGIFALVENEIIFELDAKNGSGSLAKGTTSWDKFGQTYRKTRDIIVWRRLSDEMQAILDKIEDPKKNGLMNMILIWNMVLILWLIIRL